MSSKKKSTPKSQARKSAEVSPLSLKQELLTELASEFPPFSPMEQDNSSIAATLLAAILDPCPNSSILDILTACPSDQIPEIVANFLPNKTGRLAEHIIAVMSTVQTGSLADHACLEWLLCLTDLHRTQLIDFDFKPVYQILSQRHYSPDASVLAGKLTLFS